MAIIASNASALCPDLFDVFEEKRISVCYYLFVGTPAFEPRGGDTFGYVLSLPLKYNAFTFCTNANLQCTGQSFMKVLFHKI